MGGAPVIETIRSGVQFTPDAARSFRRVEAEWWRRKNRNIDTNSTYRDWTRQMSMYEAWQAWVNGRGPKPYHSRAVHPRYSRHTSGLALDSDDWVDSAFVALMAEHGWIRVAASDPTERHHFEYQSWRDKHRNDPVPTPSNVPAGGGNVVRRILEDAMANPIINVVGKYGDPEDSGTLWIGVSDGTFERYVTPFDPNVRGVISKTFYSGEDVPSLNQRDFLTAQRLWKTMQSRR